MNKQGKEIIVYSLGFLSVVYTAARFGLDAFIVLSVIWMVLYHIDIVSLVLKD